MQSVRNFILNHKRLSLIVAVLVVGFGVYAMLSSRPETGFRVVSTNPKTSDVTFLTPFIKLEMSEPITYENVSIPKQDIVRSYITSDKTITIHLTAMDVNKSYTVKIDSITSTLGNQIKDKKYSFKAKYIEWSKLPKDQQEGLLAQQDIKQTVSNDPIVEHLPHITPDYKLTALVVEEAGASKLKLKADLTIPYAETRSDGSVPEATVEAYKELVRQYIRSINYDPARYDLTFVVVAPGSEEY